MPSMQHYNSINGMRISTTLRYIFTHPHIRSSPHSLFFSTNISSPQKRKVKGNKRNKSGVEEKKKTQGIRRDLAHHCGPSPLLIIHSFGCFLWEGEKLEGWDEKENWEGLTKDRWQGDELLLHPNFNLFTIFHGKSYYSIFLLTLHYHPFTYDV